MTLFKHTGEPMVSVVMVAYRQQDLIERAIKGVIHQKAPFPIELIIADDCSPDETYERACEWQQRYPDIVKVFRNSTNVGLQKNYLRAMGRCRGKYMAMCDADDYWCDRTKLRRQVEYMEQHGDCAITFHRVINHYASQGTKSLSNPHQPTDSTLVDLSRSNFITNCSVLYRSELVDLTNLPSWITEDVWPDYPLHIHFAAHGSIHYIPRPMAVYRRGGTGAWTAAGEYKRQIKALTVRKHLRNTFADNPEVTESFNTAIRNILVAMIRCAPSDKEKKEAINELKNDFNLTDQEINCLTNQTAPKKPITSRILTMGRKIVSSFLPLPRP